MKKVLIINNGDIYPIIHQTKGLLSTIKDASIYDYFKKNINNDLMLPSFTVCNIVYSWQSNICNSDYYIVLEANGEMCVMKKNSIGFIYITEKFKLKLLKQIFEYYNDED
jgi:hypothetical protein